MRDAVDRALKALGIRNFLLGVHDAALPSLAEEDLGRGSPYSAGAAGFFKFARSLGFTGIQLGPQGITTPGNLSPYDGTWFSRNPLSLAPLTLTRPEYNLLAPQELAALVERIGPARNRVDDPLARRAIDRIATLICLRFRRIVNDQPPPFLPLCTSYATFQKTNSDWLYRDGLYELLKTCHGGRLWREWGLDEDRHLFAAPGALRQATFYRRHWQAIGNFSYIQFLLDAQHLELHEHCRGLGLKLFGDCQIGMSDRDAWYAQGFLLPGYVLGAPPSRTHPEGQPWNYPLLDPRKYFSIATDVQRQRGSALRFFQARMEKLAREFDGLRLDHPHGLICPWVYRAGKPDPFAAVRQGARLFASPHLADHPGLAEFAIVRPDQLDERAARYDDNWVTDLDPEQVNRYAGLFAVAMQTATIAGGTEIACEILSTEPYPVKRVMELYGLGRFRVTQKADLSNKADVYRSENAQPEDWLMLSTHDTQPIWQVAERWRQEGTSLRQAEYLAMRLAIPESERAAWLEHVSHDFGSLVQAKFADLFLGPARNVFVYFTDLLGFKESYNKPGTVSRDNWTLRINPEFRQIYAAKLPGKLALDIPKALAMALRAKNENGLHGTLIRELEM
ncbi:MAG: hypothetical protein A2X81_11395 [Desulfobacterales bacterium GWB2_56_26]|nr:MAG: hypothetical protein A2X81_11395 [Desulfobacterales bacterium GWB2_56_26]